VGRLGIERRAAQDGKDQAKSDVLSREFRKAHGVSSFFNLAVVLSGTLYLFYWLKETNP
jgi:hypothetical protein